MRSIIMDGETKRALVVVKSLSGEILEKSTSIAKFHRVFLKIKLDENS